MWFLPAKPYIPYYLFIFFSMTVISKAFYPNVLYETQGSLFNRDNCFIIHLYSLHWSLLLYDMGGGGKLVAVFQALLFFYILFFSIQMRSEDRRDLVPMP